MDRRHLLALGAAGLGAPGLLRAQPATRWPERPIRLIIGWPPGGSTDTIARIFQPKLSELLGKPVIIENKGGASGSVGAAEAARAAPDGDTWLFAYDTQATNETVMRLPFRTLAAFAPISLVATGPLCMVAHHSSPYRSFADVVAAAKAAPDSIPYASSGVGGLAHVATTRLQQQGDFRLVHVPYRGGGPAVSDAVGGQVPLFMSNVVIISQHIRAGTLRPLGVTTAEQSRHVPGCPTFAEQGFSGFEAPTWWAMLGRAGTPAPILERMEAALRQVLAEPDVKARIEEQGADVIASSAAACGSFLSAEIAKWGRVIRENDIRSDS